MTIHDGHRKRMRERFRKEGLEGFAPHEVLELLLFYAKARGDVNPLAHELLDVFGSLNGVLEATPEQLMTVKGVGEETATMMSLIVPLFRRYQEGLCAEGACLFNRREVEAYCSALMAGLRTERLYVISLSTQRKVVGRRVVGEGSLVEVPAYPRAVAEAALNHNAYSVILCHNHPGGEAYPSEADIQVTHQIGDMLIRMGITLVDHIIVAGGETYSLYQHNQLKPVGRRRSIAGQEVWDEQQDCVWLDERMPE